MKGLKLGSAIIATSALLLLGGCKSSSLKTANSKFEYGEYYDAYDVYKRAVPKIKSSEKELKAQSYLRQAQAAEQIGLFEQAERLINSAFRLKIEMPELNITMAHIQHRLGKYNEAKKQYQEYLKKFPQDQLALTGLSACDSVALWKQKPTRYVVKEIPILNSKQFDFSPVVAPSNEILYFSSNRDHATGRKKSLITGYKNSDIFYSKIDQKGNWSKPALLQGEINTDQDEGSLSLSADGRRLFFTKATAEGAAGAQIYVSQASSDGFTKPSLLTILQDTSIYVGHPSISPDGDQLFFVTNIHGGQGGNDIWCASLEGDNITSFENMGPAINTPGNEIFPVCRNKDELYFASDGHTGFGGYDIYRATRTNEGGWIVTNMGAPINTNFDETGITFFGLEERGFIASNRGQSKGADKLFYFELPMLKLFIQGKASDELKRPIAKGRVHVVDNHGLNRKSNLQGGKGQFQVRAEKNTSYLIQVSAEGYLNASTEVEVGNEEKDKTYKVELTLLPISKPIEMENIFFDLNQTTLREESHKALDQLIQLLHENPNITIELGAHTDRLGTEEYNQTLSEGRAQSVVNYLLDKGIEAGRLTPKGYGKLSPKVVDSMIAKEHPFLKEGDVLDEAFISKLRKDQQDICDQINRRTEFRVLKVNYNLY